MSRRLRDVLSDDVIWQNRHAMHWIDWARLLGYHVVTVRTEAALRGWKRNPRGKILQAPCSRCGESTEIENLNHDRVCARCRYGLEQLEIAAFMEEERELYRERRKRAMKQHPAYR